MTDSTNGNKPIKLSVLLTLLLISAVVSLETKQQSRSLSLEETEAEINKLVEQHQQQLPRREARQIGAIYARYSSKDQNSILDQVREGLDAALDNSIFIPRENVFFDMATSGRRSRRKGLNLLEKCIAEKRTQAVLVFTTNRLYRKARKALEFIEKLVDELNIRCIFVRNYIDSERNEQWKRYLQFLCLFDEFASEMNVENIRASHVGKLLNRMVHGTLTYGYQGDAILDSINHNGKPNRKININPDEAKVVRQIFEWFTVESLSIKSIVQRLNSDHEIPPPRKNKNRKWTRQTVIRILSNERYVGLWAYGKTKAVLISSKDYIRQKKRDKPLKEVHFEELRLILDDIFYAAQKRLDENSNGRGRGPVDGNRITRPKVLNGYFRCPEHDRALLVSGRNGQYMSCPDCQNETRSERSLYSQLNRKVALELLCKRFTALIQSDPELIDQIVKACQEEADRLQRPDPDQINKLENRQKMLLRSIRHLMRQEPETDEEERELDTVLGEKRGELLDVKHQLSFLTKDEATKIQIPTHEEVTSLLDGLSETMLDVSESGLPDDVDFLRELMNRLTGGKIELFQMGEKSPRKGWLQGRFQCPLKSVLVQQLTGMPSIAPEEYQDVVVDFHIPDRDDEMLKRAWELKQQGKMNIEMVSILGCSRGNVTRLIKKASEIHGVPFEDGRKRRAKLKKKQLKTPQYRQIADEAVRLWNETPCYLKIAQELGCNDVLVEKAIRFWYESRNLPVPTKSVIRAQKQEEARKLLDRKVPLNVVADRLHVNPATIRNWMKKQYEAEGKPMPDLRSRRHQSPDGSESDS